MQCVGALIRNERDEVFVHRRTRDRRLLPGTWDIPGGHVELGESAESALAREVEEETGWRLTNIEAVIADWEWTHDGVTRRELDYLVEVEGDLRAPRIEVGKHDLYDWVGPHNLERMMVDRTDGDRRLRDLVAKATRIRLTERLRLEPIGPEHIDALWSLQREPWAREEAARTARERQEAWEERGIQKWMAYERTSGALIGRGGLSYQMVDGSEQLEVGWTVRSDRWGNGFATEIGRRALAFAFEDLRVARVVAFTEVGNQRSRAVMERLGMRFDKHFQHEGEPFVLYSVST